MRLALLTVALAACAALVSGTSAATKPVCSRAGARAAILATKVQVPSLAGNHGTIPVAPNQADQVICFDFTRDGRIDMAITVFSGGTAGDIAWVVFRNTKLGWRVALARGGYKLGLRRLGGDLALSQPIYRQNDPNCCPSGGFDHTRWRWNGTRFAVVRTWHDKSFTS